MARVPLGTAVLFCTAGMLWAESGDTLLYRFPPLTVIGRAVLLGERMVTASKAATYEVLETEGIVQLIRRGGLLSADLSLQGFRRADIGVTIEGIRFPNACPNRMDVPLARVEPLDVTSVVVDYSGVSVPGGIGGTVSYRRQSVGEHLLVRTALAGQFGAEPFWDGSVQGELARQRVIGRWLHVRSYTDGAGQSFGQRYGYTEEHIRSRWIDFLVRGRIGEIGYDVRYNTATDIPFPALMMDERRNITGMLSLLYGDHRLYGVYTWHRMDNGLRRASTAMQTDATTIAVGAIGPWYEAVYRFWKAESQMGGMSQTVIPSVNSLRTAAGWQGAWGVWHLALRAGLALMGLADTARLPVYRELYPEATRLRWYLPVGVAVGYRLPLPEQWNGGAQVELNGETPAEEQLFFVRVSGHGPRWVSNPTLPEPVRVSVRTMLGWQEQTQLHLAASRVWNYPTVVAHQHDGHRYLTIEGTPVWLWWAMLSHTSSYLDAVVEYTWGEHVQGRRPLSEIPPLMATLTGKSPVLWEALTLWVRGTYAAAQRRVDATVQEEPTAPWFRLDAGLRWEMPAGIVLGVEGSNLLNRLYRRHLSYIRNPYAAGTKVYEPGRSLRFWLQWRWEQREAQ